MPDLESIYRLTLERCSPENLLWRTGALACPDRRGRLSSTMPRSVVAIGKCAGALIDGVAAAIPIEQAMAVVPHGYPDPRWSGAIVVAHGGHPQIDEQSFYAGDALFRFLEGLDEVLFLISGGGSACVERPLEPWFSKRDLIDTNARLIAAGIPIRDINTVRKHLSAIKGGRLATRVRGRTVTLIYSDVSSGAFEDVAAGPTVPDSTTNAQAAEILERIGAGLRIVDAVPETMKRIANASWRVIADNDTLVDTAAATAASMGLRVHRWNGQIESDVDVAAAQLAERAQSLKAGEILVAGGEPTVKIRGDGTGGRCSELAVRFAMRTNRHQALFASSDGVDGNSGAAGVLVDPEKGRIDPLEAADALGRSDSLSMAGSMGRAVIIPATGNNLRDLYLVAQP